ncbi:MAG: cupin domain-containing protein [Nakamurella sp.]
MNTTPANIDQILAGFDETWAPRIVATMNDYAVKIARLDGEYVWHAHHDTDEVFLVLSGTVDIALRTADTESSVRLQPNEVFVVPRGVEHRPSASTAVVLLIEPLSTLSTGDFAGEVPKHITSTTGLET